MFDAGKLLTDLLGGAKGAAANPQETLGQVGGILGAVLNQAVAGVQEGATEIEKRTGVGATLSEAAQGITGKSPGEMIGQLKELAEKNKLATGAALGGLGALVLGTRTGRGLAGDAAALGGLALIGGLAWKAWQNHQQGKPPIDMGGQLSPAPAESPFGGTGETAADNALAILVIRSMIAAAASDGVIDNEERSRIVGALVQAGLDEHAAKFLDAEFASPASAAAIAEAAKTPEDKAQAYTAALVAIDTPSAAEAAFLADLAGRMGLSADQTAQFAAAVAAHRG